MVKKTSFKDFAALILMLVVPLIGFAQEEKSNPKINIKTNPFGALANTIPLGVEVFPNSALSFSVNAFYIHSETGTSSTFFGQDGFGIGPELRWYFLETETKGQKNRVYLGAQYNYEESTNTTLDRLSLPIDGWSHAVGGAFVFGNQWFFRNRFTFDVFMGPGYMNYVKNENYDTNLSKGGFFLSMAGAKASGTRIKFGFSIGISF